MTNYPFERVSAGNALFKIIGFIFEVVSKIFDIMNTFEIFPGVTFLDFVFVVIILNLLISFAVQNFWSDAISANNLFEKNEPTKEEYVGKHEYKPKHAKKER